MNIIPMKRVLLALLLVLVAAGGVYFYVAKRNSGDSARAIVTEGWQVYADAKNGYTFKYAPSLVSRRAQNNEFLPISDHAYFYKKSDVGDIVNGPDDDAKIIFESSVSNIEDHRGNAITKEKYLQLCCSEVDVSDGAPRRTQAVTIGGRKMYKVDTFSDTTVAFTTHTFYYFTDKKVFMFSMGIFGGGAYQLDYIGATPEEQQTYHEFENSIATLEITAPVEVAYTSNQYGFVFLLPESWKGYSGMESTWEGLVLDVNGEGVEEQGPIILIRHPQWTAQAPRQDIPIMIFTIRQWNDLQQDKFHIGAAPIGPSELGRNANYVFALPARYNYAFPAGYEEVEQILKGGALQAF